MRQAKYFVLGALLACAPEGTREDTGEELGQGSDALVVLRDTFNTDQEGWIEKGNVTLLRVTSPTPQEGAGALQMKATALGNIRAGTPMFAVTAGKTYTLRGWVRAGSTGRNAGIQIDWFNSAGSYLSSSSRYATDSTTWSERAVTAVAPTGATQAVILAVFTSCAASEVHYVDNVSLDDGSGTGPTVLFSDTFTGTDMTNYIHMSRNSTTFPWYAEPYSGGCTTCDGIDRVANVGRKPGTWQFFRAWNRVRYGGPGKSVSIRARVKMLSLFDRADGSGTIREGFRLWVKFPHPSLTNPDDPSSVRGTGNDPTSPASIAAVALAEDGYMEFAYNGFGEVEYEWYVRPSFAPWNFNQWYAIRYDVEWLPNTQNLRLRQYRDGVLMWEHTQLNSPLYPYKAYVGIRSDDVTWEVDDFEIVDITPE